MRLTFIGTSHGIPEAEHRCSCAMIDIGGRIYFIDMGTQAIEDLRRRSLPVESVKGIFITHMHGDHVNGLLSFVDLCNWFFTGADPKIYLPTQEGVDGVNGWLKALDKREPRGIDLRVTNEGVVFDDGYIKVTAVRTQHCRVSYAYIVEAEGKTLLFTGDLRSPGVDYPKEVFGRTLDAVICESAHFDPIEYLAVFDKSDVKSVYINHLQPRKAPLALGLISALGEKNIPARLANDGMEINL